MGYFFPKDNSYISAPEIISQIFHVLSRYYIYKYRERKNVDLMWNTVLSAPNFRTSLWQGHKNTSMISQGTRSSLHLLNRIPFKLLDKVFVDYVAFKKQFYSKL